MANKPDFIIIGAMKCATSSIHTQLAQQPGIFMSTPKEPNFFSDDNEYARGIAWYEALFADAKPGDLCGESSTHYTKLPHYPDCLARMKAYLPAVKLIYVMRHPVDRLVSHYIHQWSQNEMTCDIDQAVDSSDELIAYSSYAKQLQPYIDAYGKASILPVFFEAVKARPAQELQRIASFIGYDGTVTWVDELAQQNASNERIKRFPGYELLVDSPVMTQMRRLLIPKFIRERIKKNLTMQNRPVLSTDTIERLTEHFDSDLAIVGAWLGLELNCGNFTQTVLNTTPVWR